MPLISLNAVGTGLALAGTAGDLRGDIARSLALCPKHAAVVVLIHGYRFSPDYEFSNPHTHILALKPSQNCWKAISWPRHLGFGRSPDEGLCIGFGWQALGTIWQAYRAAANAGAALAGLIRMIQDIDPGRRVDVLAHSLGARVLLCALPNLDAGAVGRVILMAGAEFRSPAAAALQTRAGQTAEFVNITTRENDLFDLLLEWSVRAPNAGDLSLGLGLAEPAGNWLDVQIDHGATLKALAALGHRIAAPERWICHWSAYLRPGLFALYRALLSGSDCLPLARLRAHLPGGKQPRWSRIRQWPSLRQPLPLPWKAAS